MPLAVFVFVPALELALVAVVLPLLVAVELPVVFALVVNTLVVTDAVDVDGSAEETVFVDTMENWFE